MKYKILKKQQFVFDKYSISPLRKKDLFSIMKWRNEQIQILRQSRILTKDDQMKYYKRHIYPSYRKSEPSIILFSFLLKGKCIGYGGLTNIDWGSKRSELSFLLKTSRFNSNNLYNKEFSIFLKLIKEVAFMELKFNRLFTETFDIRQKHIEILERNGFRIEGRLNEHVIIDGKARDSLIHGILKKYLKS